MLDKRLQRKQERRLRGCEKTDNEGGMRAKGRRAYGPAHHGKMQHALEEDGGCLLHPPAHTLTFRSLVPPPPSHRGAQPAASLGSQILEVSQGDAVLRATALPCPTYSPAVLARVQPSSCLGWVEHPSHTPKPQPAPQSSPTPKQLPRVQSTVQMRDKQGHSQGDPSPASPWAGNPPGVQHQPCSHPTQPICSSSHSPPAPRVPRPACPCPRAVARGLSNGKSRAHLSVGLLPIFPGTFCRSKSHHMKKFKLVPQQRQE